MFGKRFFLYQNSIFNWRRGLFCFNVIATLIILSQLVANSSDSFHKSIEKSNPITLSLEQRIQCQYAIEAIYWDSIIWPIDNPNPKPPMAAIMSENIITAKVENALRKSNALEFYWHKPITGEQLQAEMERIAKKTRKPEILKLIIAKLNDSPYMMAECLARPYLPIGS